MVLPPDLLELLACPCPEHAGLRTVGEAELECSACGLRFPVEDGIPVLLPPEAG